MVDDAERRELVRWSQLWAAWAVGQSALVRARTNTPPAPAAIVAAETALQAAGRMLADEAGGQMGTRVGDAIDQYVGRQSTLLAAVATSDRDDAAVESAYSAWTQAAKQFGVALSQLCASRAISRRSQAAQVTAAAAYNQWIERQQILVLEHAMARLSLDRREETVLDHERALSDYVVGTVASELAALCPPMGVQARQLLAQSVVRRHH